MNIQKIQTSTKGFTLVELIVVITILVILGTIAFLNLGGFSASARDSQRTSDLNQINQQVMTMQTKSAIPYLSMLSGALKLDATTAIIGGTGNTTVSDYNAGDINYTVLSVDKNKFKDPVSGAAYRMGATTRVGGAYELGASLEETKTALVIGTYKPRDLTATASGASVSGNTITLATGLGLFKVNDVITDGTSFATVTSISAGLNNVTLSGTLVNSAAFKLQSAEVKGLIGSGTSVVTDKGIILPY